MHVPTISNSALTQKDSFSRAMKSGIRYFDFRPAGLVNKFLTLDAGKHDHTHAIVPGSSLHTFLDDAADFLVSDGKEHEVIFVNINSSGIDTDEIETSVGTFQLQPLYTNDGDSKDAQTYISDKWADSSAASSVTPMFIDDFSDISDKSMSELYDGQNRLIVIFGRDDINDSYPSSDSDVEKYYGTYDPSNVIDALNNNLENCQSTSKYSVFQLQDTSQVFIANNIKGTWETILNGLGSENGSLLLQTKGMFDNQTYYWVDQNLRSCETMTVMLNDFGDNLLALLAKRITESRTGIGQHQYLEPSKTCD